ncbi:MAG: ATP-binding protein [Methylococcus sp.]
MSRITETDCLKRLYELSMTLSGDPMDIFAHVARMLGELLEVKVVCLSEIRGSELHFLSVYDRGALHVNAGHCVLDITPCATVETSKNIRIYDRVMERFPDAHFLREHNAYAYCGLPSLDGAGKVVAVTCLLDDRPREFGDDELAVLTIASQRIGMEIARKNVENEGRASLAALRQSEERLELALRGADLGLWDWNIETGEVFFSDRWLSMLGYSRESIEPGYAQWQRLVHPEDLPEVLKALHAHLSGEAPYYEVEHRLLTREGAWKWVWSSGRVWQRDAAGLPLRATGTHLDISLRKELEGRLNQQQAMLSHAQRVTIAGELAATIVHELNQPLGAISSYIGAASLEFAGLLALNPRLNETLNETQRLTQRAAQVVRGIRDLVRRSTAPVEAVDMAVVLDEILSYLQGELLRRSIRVNKALPSGLPAIHGDRIQLQQLFLNLLLNALDAMSEVATANRLLTVQAAIHPGCSITLIIRDSGPGLAPEIAENLFQPFLTTKPHGIGLGLSLCRTIAQTHGGSIAATSAPGQGACFEVTLPIGGMQHPP